MPEKKLPPNELADLYDALFTVLENLPDETHPAWQLAVESVVFGGEGLAPEATNYGEQQSERNEFTITAYRDQHGDGDQVTEFPTLTMREPAEQDTKFVDSEHQIPVAPDSKTVLPLFVDDDSLEEAIALLNEFPAEPDADLPGDGVSVLLDTSKFPGLSRASVGEGSTAHPEADGNLNPELAPNELADLYDALYQAHQSLPDGTHPLWQEAVETVIFGGEFLASEATPYGEQQANRNEFGMPEYRTKYGDSERVTEFPTLTTHEPTEAEQVDGSDYLRLPVAPESGTVLPLDPSREELPEAVALLTEFPAEPAAESPGEGHAKLLDVGRLFAEIDGEASGGEMESPGQTANSTDDSTSPQASADRTTEHVWDDASILNQDIEPQTSKSDPASEGNPTTQSDDSQRAEETMSTPSEQSASETAPDGTEESGKHRVLRRNGPGEGSISPEEVTQSAGGAERKYEDPRAERAHRRAQQRDPSDVVEVGEVITLVLKEVDFSSNPPTIMGTKNQLVVFVTDVPQDVSVHDTIRAKVTDYGGKNNSAEAVFKGHIE